MFRLSEVAIYLIPASQILTCLILIKRGLNCVVKVRIVGILWRDTLTVSVVMRDYACAAQIQIELAVPSPLSLRLRVTVDKILRAALCSILAIIKVVIHRAYTIEVFVGFREQLVDLIALKQDLHFVVQRFS